SLVAFLGSRIVTPSSGVTDGAGGAGGGGGTARPDGSDAGGAGGSGSLCAGALGVVWAPLSSMLVSCDLPLRLIPSLTPPSRLSRLEDLGGLGGRSSVRSLPQGMLNGGSSDRTPVAMSASSEIRKKRFHDRLSSQRAYAMNVSRTPWARRATPRAT